MLSLGVQPAGSTEGFVQEITFPLRVRALNSDLLPLTPVFAMFEDPEYNRRPASPTAQETSAIQIDGELRAVKPAADRTDYNPGGLIAMRWNFVDAAPVTPPAATLSIQRKDRSGILKAIPVTPANPGPEQLVTLSLAASGVLLAPGDVLHVELLFPT